MNQTQGQQYRWIFKRQRRVEIQKQHTIYSTTLCRYVLTDLETESEEEKG